MTTAVPAGFTPPDNVGGFVFVAPKRGPTQEGPMILDRDGEVVWFHPVEGDQQAFDFRVQQYEGRDVLTWWEGAVALYRGSGTGRIVDSSYRDVARVEMANGYEMDAHEFELTDRGTALVMAYVPVPWDTTGGRRTARRDRRGLRDPGDRRRDGRAAVRVARAGLDRAGRVLPAGAEEEGPVPRPVPLQLDPADAGRGLPGERPAHERGLQDRRGDRRRSSGGWAGSGATSSSARARGSTSSTTRGCWTTGRCRCSTTSPRT